MECERVETCNLDTLHACAWVRVLHHWTTWWNMMIKTVKIDEVLVRRNSDGDGKG